MHPHLLRREGSGRLLVLLHGAADDPAPLIALAEDLDPDRRWTVVVPRGPLEGPEGPSWFDPDDPARAPSLAAAVEATRRLVRDVCEERDLDPAEAVLCGYSQGAAVALSAVASRGPDPGSPPAGVVALAGFLPHDSGIEWDLDAAAPTALLVVHGRDDEVVDPMLGRSAARALARQGARVVWREVPGGHALGEQLLAPVVPWLAAVARGERPADPADPPP